MQLTRNSFGGQGERRSMEQVDSKKASVLEAAVPVLSVEDLTAALEYYQRVLGFQVAWSLGDSPHLASVCRDRVEPNGG